MKFLFALAQLEATVVRAEAWCTGCYKKVYFNWKFETLFFCRDWNCS